MHFYFTERGQLKIEILNKKRQLRSSMKNQSQVAMITLSMKIPLTMKKRV